MTHILTIDEAANAVRTNNTDVVMLDLLPLVDAYIKNATGRDWTGDSPINPTAKSCARMLLVMYYDNPSMLDSMGSLPQGLSACLTQLEALKLRYTAFEGLNGAGYITLYGAQVNDSVTNLVGLIGVSGDQSSNFETMISTEGQIKQIYTGDLSGKYYRAYLTPLDNL